MATLRRWDPIREMMSLRSTMDRLFDESAFGPYLDTQYSTWNLPLDVMETDENFVVKAAIPGINPEDLDLTIEDNVLTIKGKLEEEQEDENVNYHLRERRFGSFTRSIRLPTHVDAEHVEAHYNDGILKLMVPKAEEVRPKRITVQTDGTKILEG